MAPATRALLDVRTLLSDYLELSNKVIAENNEKFWFRQAKRLNPFLRGDAKFRTLVYQAQPNDIAGEYTIQFDAEREQLSLLPGADYETMVTWKVPLDYIRDVVETRPEWYVEHPLMLDWKWLSGRVRDEVTTRAGSPARAAAVGAFGLGAVVGAAVMYVFRGRAATSVPDRSAARARTG